MGGYNSNWDVTTYQYHNDVWASIDGGQSWTQQTPKAPWGSRCHFGAVAHKGVIVIMGGYLYNSDGTETYYNDVWSSSDQGRTWQQVADDTPWHGRELFGLVQYQGVITLMGGRYHNDPAKKGDYTHYADVYQSQDLGKTWKALHTAQNPAPWGATTTNGRSGMATAVHPDGTIALMGGSYSPPEGGDAQYLNDVWVSKDGANWTCATSAAQWSARSHIAAVAVGPYFLVAGGYYWDSFSSPGNQEKHYNDVWTSVDHGKTWKNETKNAEWHSRELFGLVASDKTGYATLMGGRYHTNQNFKGHYQYYNDTWESNSTSHIFVGTTWHQVDQV